MSDELCDALSAEVVLHYERITARLIAAGIAAGSQDFKDIMEAVDTYAHAVETYTTICGASS